MEKYAVSAEVSDSALHNLIGYNLIAHGQSYQVTSRDVWISCSALFFFIRPSIHSFFER